LTAKHLIIISFDALSSLDYVHLDKLPNFSLIKETGSYARKVYSVYPSLTYPAHTTIITGRYPKNHGIINNTLLQPGWGSPDWYWYRRDIKGETLYDKAVDAGLTTAALLWPVTARSRIKYNMPEIFSNRWWTNQIMVSIRNGNPLYQLELNNKFGRLRKGLNQPELDNFVLESAVHTIKKNKPNLMLIHFTDLDTQRHDYGYSSSEALEAINRHDKRLGDIINSLKEAGIYENSTIIALGDHSALNESKIININVLLREHNLISLDRNNKIKSWKAYLKTCDGSAYIYLKDKNDMATKNLVHKLLIELKSNPSNGIEAIYTSEEAEKLGADHNCTFMLEAKLGFYFLEDYSGPLIKEINSLSVDEQKHFTKATHGYSPFKADYTTMFIASGKGIKGGEVIDSINLVDEAPTFAALLGLKLDHVDGRILNEILA
jgi:predicted AlkP superfamily pyrophosphatase or phosphodiesterase